MCNAELNQAAFPPIAPKTNSGRDETTWNTQILCWRSLIQIIHDITVV